MDPTLLTSIVASHGLAALAYLVLTLLIAGRSRGRGPGLLLLGAVAATGAWCAAVAWTGGAFTPAATLGELARSGLLLAFLAALLTVGLEGRRRRLLPPLLALGYGGCVLLVAADAGWIGWEPPAPLTGGLVARLAMALAGLTLIENLVRNTARARLWSGKFLFVGLGAIFAYDFVLFAEALLFRQVNPQLLAGRGAVQILAVPLLAIAAARNPAWSLDIGVSRRVVFHTAALMASGAFLMALAAAGYYLREFGGSWGPLLQTTALVGGAILLVVMLASGRIRGRLRLFINQHFFSYKYDYRAEWLRFIGTLSVAETDSPLPERVIRAVADILDSPGGALWHRPLGSDEFVQIAVWNFPTLPVVETPDGGLIRFLETEGQTVDLVAARRGGVGTPAPELPEWLASAKQAWLVVPLMHGDRLVGFLVLQHSRAPRMLDWEDWDLLKTVGRQAASYLAEQSAIQAIADARQLEAFNRRFAFVMHDLKNLVSPLSMLLASAPRHAGNPEFQQDLVATVQDSVERMKRMLLDLGQARQSEAKPAPVALDALVRRVAEERRHNCLSVQTDGTHPIVTADADKLGVALGHLAQNAIDAAGGTGQVVLRLATRGDRAVIEIEDNGPGMAPEFIRDELFRPLSSTKNAGYGIGAYQARELIREMGGRLSVASTPGEGTVMRVGFALLPAALSQMQVAAQ